MKLKPTKIRSDKERLFEENLRFKMLVNSYKTENSQLQGRIRQLESTLNKKDILIQELTVNIENPSYKSIHLISKLSLNLRENTERLQSALEELNALREIRYSSDPEILKKKINDLQGNLAQLSNENEEIKKKNHDFQLEIIRLEKNNNEYLSFKESENIKNNAKKLKIKEISKENKELKIEIGVLKKEIEAGNRKKNELEGKIIENNKENSKIIAENESLKKENQQQKENLSQMITNNDQQKENLLEITKNNEMLKEKFSKMEKSKKELIENLQKQIEIKDNEAKDAITKSKNLENTMKDLPKTIIKNYKFNIINSLKTLKIASHAIFPQEKNNPIPPDKEIEDILLMISFSLQLERLLRSELPDILFTNKCDQLRLLTQEELSKRFKDPTFSFIKKNKGLIDKLSMFLIQYSKRHKADTKASINDIITGLFKLIPDWSILTDVVEEMLDKKLSIIIAMNYNDLQNYCKSLDKADTGKLTIIEFLTVNINLSILLDDKLKQYIFLLSYSFENEIDKIPYKKLFQAYISQLDKLNAEEIIKIAEHYLELFMKSFLVSDKKLWNQQICKKNKIKIKKIKEYGDKLNWHASIMKLITNYFNLLGKKEHFVPSEIFKNKLKSNDLNVPFEINNSSSSSDSSSSKKKKKKSDNKESNEKNIENEPSLIRNLGKATDLDKLFINDKETKYEKKDSGIKEDKKKLEKKKSIHEKNIINKGSPKKIENKESIKENTDKNIEGNEEEKNMFFIQQPKAISNFSAPALQHPEEESKTIKYKAEIEDKIDEEKNIEKSLNNSDIKNQSSIYVSRDFRNHSDTIKNEKKEDIKDEASKNHSILEKEIFEKEKREKESQIISSGTFTLENSSKANMSMFSPKPGIREPEISESITSKGVNESAKTKIQEENTKIDENSKNEESGIDSSYVSDSDSDSDSDGSYTSSDENSDDVSGEYSEGSSESDYSNGDSVEDSKDISDIPSGSKKSSEKIKRNNHTKQ